MLNSIFLRLQPSLKPILLPFALLYKFCMQIRALAYRHNLLSCGSFPRPCISVGNISWGGSGKTPLCLWLLNRLIEQGKRPVLISRGYKARPPTLPYAVKPDDDPQKSGDEPLMLARACAQARIIIDPKRSRAGNWALKNLNPDLFIFDDAFQHLKVKRDLDLVLLRAQDLCSDWNQVIPAGSWREGEQALKRASAFLVNVEPDQFRELKDKVQKRLVPFSKPVFSFYSEIQGIIRVQDQVHAPLPEDRPYILTTGVGDPDRVLKSASRALGCSPAKKLVFDDHHPFSAQDWQHIRSQADIFNCKYIFCTPKDAVKLKKYADSSLWTFELGLNFGPYMHSALNFPDWLEKNIFFC